MDSLSSVWQLFFWLCTAAPVLVVWVLVTTLCVGSFTNVVAYRLVHNKKFFAARSRCPSCDAIIPWYLNIPVVAYVFLRGRAQCCGTRISPLYPCIELLTMLVFSLHALFFSTQIQQGNMSTFAVYIIPVWALIIAIRTDLEALVILSPFSLWLCPLGWIAAWQGILPITLFESVAGTLLGYGFLWIVNYVARLLSGRHGVGQGDMELLAMIGSFWGVAAIPLVLWGAACIGVVYALVRAVFCGVSLREQIPFAPALAAGALCGHYYMLMQIL